MGMPVYRMQMEEVGDHAPWLLINTSCYSFYIDIFSGGTILRSKVLHDLAGNGMAVRSVMAAICAALSATEPQLMSHNHDWPYYRWTKGCKTFFVTQIANAETTYRKFSLSHGSKLSLYISLYLTTEVFIFQLVLRDVVKWTKMNKQLNWNFNCLLILVKSKSSNESEKNITWGTGFNCRIVSAAGHAGSLALWSKCWLSTWWLCAGKVWSFWIWIGVSWLHISFSFTSLSWF